jgi:hypothetical protein
VVSFTPRPLYPFYRRLSGPQSRSGRRGEEKILDPTGTRTPDPSVVRPVASRYTDYADLNFTYPHKNNINIQNLQLKKSLNTTTNNQIVGLVQNRRDTQYQKIARSFVT